MKKISFLVVLAFFVGCGENPSINNKASKSVKSVKKVVTKVVDPCEVEYQKCSVECKVSTLNEADWKKTACEAKCKTIYGACKTKQKTIEGINYIKEKVSN